MARYRDPFLDEDEEMYSRQPKTAEERMAERMDEIRREVAATKGVGPIADGSAYASNLDEAKPKQVRRVPQLSNLESPTSDTPAPIDTSVLNEMAKKDPSLIERYRERMGLADGKVKQAEKLKEYAGYANVAGKIFEDLSNADKQDVILYNRMSDLGRAPVIRQQERDKLDLSLMNEAVDDRLKNAKADRDRDENQFFTEDKLTKTSDMRDPSSKESQSAREYLKMLAPGVANKIPSFDTLNAEQLDRAAPTIMAKWKEENADRRHRESLANKRQATAGKESILDRKRKEQIQEVGERTTNIRARVSELKEMVKDKGTFEAFGPHNQNIERKVDQIATDMAKLMDPSSVARPSEVELIKKGLIQSGFTNRNSTAIQVLEEFENEIDGRVAEAYRIRGLDIPGASTGGGQTLSADEQEALQWAEDHPDDPRAKEIREKLGQ